MADRFELSTARLFSRLQDRVAFDITYRRGLSAVTLSAVSSSVEFELQEADGFLVRRQSTAWDVPADELVLDSVLSTPQRGDIVDHDVNGVILKYAVSTPNATGPAFEYTDPFRIGIRIFTILGEVV